MKDTGGMMRSTILLAVLALALFLNSPVFGDQDPADIRLADTVRVGLCPISVTSEMSEGDSFSVPIYIWNDEQLGGFTLGLKYNYDYVVIQSINFEGSALTVVQQAFVSKLFYPQDNAVLVGWAPFGSPNEAYLQPTDQDTASLILNLNMRVLEGATTTNVGLDSVYVPPAGDFILVINLDTTGATSNTTQITPEFVGCTGGSAVQELGSPTLPESFSVSQNVPNPFNPDTYIEFALPKSAQVKVEVYNMLGQKVTTLVDEVLDAGRKRVQWDGTSSSGNAVASGVYFYRVVADEFSETRKMVLLK